MTENSITISHLLGEVSWLYTQSKIHRNLPMSTLDIVAMPALLKEQIWIFRDGDQPVGAAFWAYCNEATEKKLQDGPLLASDPLTLDDWNSGDRIWLVDLLAPFANDNNKHVDMMMADLASGPLKGREFNFHQMNPATGKKEVVTIPADMSARIVAAANDSK